MELSDFLDQIDLTDLSDAQQEVRRKAICVMLAFGAEVTEKLNGKQVTANLYHGWLIVKETANEQPST